MSKEDFGLSVEDLLKDLDLKDVLKGIEEQLDVKVQLKKKPKPREELVELHPYGLMAGVDKEKPVFVFKDETEKHVFPIWLSNVETNQLAVSLNPVAAEALFASFQLILKALDVNLDQLIFTEIKDLKVMAELEISQGEEKFVVPVHVNEVLALCLYSKIGFFANEDLMEQARLMDMNIHKSNSEVEFHMEKSSSDQKYLI